jgi:hypothetical protein
VGPRTLLGGFNSEEAADEPMDAGYQRDALNVGLTDYAAFAAEESSRLASLWAGTTAGPTLIPADRRGRWRRERRIAKATRHLAALARQAPSPQRDIAKRAWTARLGTELLRLDDDSHTELFVTAFLDTGARFARELLQPGRRLRHADLFQAVRNAWVVNIVQRLFRIDACTSDDVVAYSLLYPHTDNWLDDPTIPADAKANANRRIAQRLRGAVFEPGDEYERIFVQLFSIVEKAHPRLCCPDLYACLSALHTAQERSLLQRPDCSDANLMRITIEKGGLAVIADGLLVKGRVDTADRTLLFRIGALLQLVDDLTDLSEDADTGTDTPFTRAVSFRQACVVSR